MNPALEKSRGDPFRSNDSVQKERFRGHDYTSDRNSYAAQE